MASRFSWLDHSERERRRVLDAIDKFKETDTRDELGLGSLRDGFADLFFPGTSTIQTRARYFLFVPWIYQRAEAKGAAERLAVRVRREEVKLSEALLKADDHAGVVGRISGAATQRLPSSLYWLGLASWNIRLFPGSQDDYHRSMEHRQRRARDVVRDDDGDRVDGHGTLAWHPHLPPPPAEFPDVASFVLTRAEARYLEERITFAKPTSLMAFLVRKGRTFDAVFPWAHPQFAEFPKPTRDALEHARLLSETMQGAALLYNLMLAEELPPGEARERGVEDYRSRLEAWCTELQHREHAIRLWDRTAFWGLAHEIANVKVSTKDFVDTWVNLQAWRSTTEASESSVARTLIRDRELRLKGKARARLGNPRALENWRGESGTAPLSYRWGPAVRILSDIQAAGGAHA